jgi:outer membrane lipoprotein-sorting protein
MRFWASLAGACLLAAACLAQPAAAGEGFGLAQAREVMDRMARAYHEVRDYRCTFYKQIYYQDEGLSSRDRILFKFRKPFSVYMRWLNEPHAGREVIYVAGKWEGKLWVHKGSFPDLTLCLDPEFCQSVTASRHPVTEAGMGYAIELVRDNLARAAANPDHRVRVYDHGRQELYGEACRCFEAVMPPDKGYYSHRAKICQSLRTGLLLRITIWDHDGRMIEDYGFANLEANVGLSDQDFDPDNPAYDF